MIIILNVTYFIAIFWWILAVCQEDFVYDVNFATNPEMMEVYSENFYASSGLADDPGAITAAILYFSFTSLSTVGFGDYHPTNDIERMIGAFILLFGVAIFSVVMQNFVDILT